MTADSSVAVILKRSSQKNDITNSGAQKCFSHLSLEERGLSIPSELQVSRLSSSLVLVSFCSLPEQRAGQNQSQPETPHFLLAGP